MKKKSGWYNITKLIKKKERMKMQKYKLENIDDYLNRLTPEQAEELIVHCNEYDIFPNICAWYDDMDDFFDDWCEQVGLTEKEAQERFKEGKEIGEFKQFSDEQIIRLAM